MPQVPRIRRVEPSTAAMRPQVPIAVTATLQWHNGDTDDVDALALAWTAHEVEVEWTTPWGDTRSDWLPATAVRRR